MGTGWSAVAVAVDTHRMQEGDIDDTAALTDFEQQGGPHVGVRPSVERNRTARSERAACNRSQDCTVAGARSNRRSGARHAPADITFFRFQCSIGVLEDQVEILAPRSSVVIRSVSLANDAVAFDATNKTLMKIWVGARHHP